MCTYALFCLFGRQKSLSFALKDFVLIIFLKYIFEIFCNETLLINTPLTIKADLNTIKIHFPNPNTYNFFFLPFSSITQNQRFDDSVKSESRRSSKRPRYAENDEEEDDEEDDVPLSER